MVASKTTIYSIANRLVKKLGQDLAIEVAEELTKVPGNQSYRRTVNALLEELVNWNADPKS